jgi:hypothetical protein
VQVFYVSDHVKKICRVSKTNLLLFSIVKALKVYEKGKDMLLSLALFAVVGAVLAFRVKFNAQYCTTDAYWNGSNEIPHYYCSFPVDPVHFTTTSCRELMYASGKLTAA